MSSPLRMSRATTQLDVELPNGASDRWVNTRFSEQVQEDR